MRRITLAVIWVSVIVIASFGLYRVKYEVQSLKAQIVQVSLEMEEEKELLHVEAAEWAYLNRPENIKKMADKYLGGKNVTVGQVAEVEAIAFPKQSIAAADIIPDTRSIPVSYRNDFMHR